MCLLIVLRGFDHSHPVAVAANRDERRDRKAAPPGLFVGARRKLLSPRDRMAGGTWLAVSAAGMFAGITNVAGAPPVAGAPTRGDLPHVALDAAGDGSDLDAAVDAVRAEVRARPRSGFQLVLANAHGIRVVRGDGGSGAGPAAGSDIETFAWAEPVLVVTNLHRPGALALPGLEAALGPFPDVERRLDALAQLLLDRGGDGRHEVLKKGDAYGTVSSSLLAIPAADPRALVWRYAAGPPDEAPYRSYGNLGRRLVDE